MCSNHVRQTPSRQVERRTAAFQCCLVSLPEKHGDSGYGYREYLTPEKLQENQQREIYPDESEGLLRIQAQDRRCTV